MKFYSFWRSLASYRVRIAMNLKALTPDEVIDVNLMKGQQRDDAFRKVNPMMALPALVDGEGPALFESLAIIEYLDETHPNPPLLPKDPKGRARCAGSRRSSPADSHPLIVPRVREHLAHEFKADEATIMKWAQHWHSAALKALDVYLADKATGKHRPRRPDHHRRHLHRESGRGRDLLQGRSRAVPELQARARCLHGGRCVRAGASAEAAGRAGVGVSPSLSPLSFRGAARSPPSRDQLRLQS